MKRFLSAIIIFAMLMGFSACGNEVKSEPSTEPTTKWHNELNTEASTETASNVEAQSKKTTEKNYAVQSEIETKIQATKPKEKATDSTEIYAFKDDNPDKISFRKRGNMFFVDDKKYAAGQTSIEGLSLESHFVSEQNETEKIVISFSNNGKPLTVVSSKGAKGYRMIGGEIVVLTESDGKYCVPEADACPKIEIEVADKSGNSILKTDYAAHWWANGFYEGEIEGPNDITSRSRITFANEDTAKLFATKLAEKGFKAVPDKHNLKENTYFAQGADVWYEF